MRSRSWILLGALLLSAAPGAARAQAVTVFAAASLTDALKDAAAAWVARGHPRPVLSFASSSTLARQIENGAPANVFASADERWMDDVAQKGMVAPGTRSDLLTNDLVLVVPADHARTVTIAPGFDLLGLLGPDGRLAVGDPAHVPAGIYARQALTRLGVWDAVSAHLARAEDVRGALLLVERDEAPAGIVYSTDAAVSKGVRVAGTFPADSHDPITYPFALTTSGATPEARAFLDFLHGDVARAIFAKRGFGTK